MKAPGAILDDIGTLAGRKEPEDRNQGSRGSRGGEAAAAGTSRRFAPLRALPRLLLVFAASLESASWTTHLPETIPGVNSLRPHLHTLPPAPVPSYSTYRVTVRKWSTIRVANKTYSVTSRLIGHKVDVRQHADWVAVLYGGRLM